MVAEAKEIEHSVENAPTDSAVRISQQDWVNTVMTNPSCFSDVEFETAEQLALGEVHSDESPASQEVTAIIRSNWPCDTIRAHEGDELEGRILGDGVLLANFSAPVPEWDSPTGCDIHVAVTIPDTSAWVYTLTHFGVQGEEDTYWEKTRDELDACGWRTGYGC